VELLQFAGSPTWHFFSPRRNEGGGLPAESSRLLVMVVPMRQLSFGQAIDVAFRVRDELPQVDETRPVVDAIVGPNSGSSSS
jgi:hypothetical protein